MLHENADKLTSKTKDLRRATDSLREELEAIDAYNQRADACEDEDLKKILIHNADEEREHSAMLIEWIRRNDSAFSSELKENLFSDKEDISKHD